ncbi:hypothetical protein GW943_00795 [Candidatus Parcubacteria bacterium]|nr:hypothetical protein [Candidatus Parcubacteria bacterium]
MDPLIIGAIIAAVVVVAIAAKIVIGKSPKSSADDNPFKGSGWGPPE